MRGLYIAKLKWELGKDRVDFVGVAKLVQQTFDKFQERAGTHHRINIPPTYVDKEGHTWGITTSGSPPGGIYLGGMAESIPKSFLVAEVYYLPLEKSEHLKSN